MYGVGDSESQAISRESNISFSSTVMHPDMLKSRELMDSDPYHHQQHQYQNHQQQGSALTRYRSAPSSFFASLMEDDFLNRQSSSESEAIFATLVSPDGSGRDSESHDLLFPTDIKHETPEKNQFSICQTSLDHHDLANSVASGTVMENQEQGKRSGGGNCSNLIRQSSSPAGFFSALTAESEFGDMRDVGSFRVGNGINSKAGPTNSMNGFINFSSGPSSSSRFMPQITENGNESIEAISQENGHLGNGNSINEFFAPSSQNRSWNDSRFSGLKRNRDVEEQNYPSFNASESQNGDSRHYTTGLTHHLSLPKTSAEMAAIEKFFQFQQDSVPCKIRAKRGCATHPRSIAERTRRTRISERMRKLQELFPNMDKQTNTADMLDLAVEYIKDLQKELKTLTDTQAKCTCSTKQKQFPNPPV